MPSPYDALLTAQPKQASPYDTLLDAQPVNATAPIRAPSGLGDALKETASGAVQGTGLPALSRLSKAVSGSQPYPWSVEGASQLAGDVGTTAGVGALATTTGPLNALKTGSTLGALGGAFNASPIGKGLHEAAETAMETNGGLPTANRPSKMLGVEGLGTAYNAASRLPATLLSTAEDFLPNAALMAAGGKAMDAGKSAPIKTAPEVEASKMLESSGGKATPSMKAPGKSGWKVKADSLASNLAPGTMEEINNKNIGAVKKYVDENLPATSKSPLEIGNQIADAVDAFKAQRSAEFGNAEDLVSKVQLPPNVNSGQFAQQAIDSLLKSKGVKPGQNNLTGNEPIDPNAVGPLNRLRAKLSNAKSIQDLINQRRQWEDSEGPSFPEGMKGRGEAILQTGRGLVNEVIGQLLEFNDRLQAQGGPVSQSQGLTAPSGNMGAPGARPVAEPIKPIWDAANAKYAATQPLLQDIYSTIGEKRPNGMRDTQISPENFYNQIITKLGGANRVAQLKQILGENFKPFEDAAVKQLLPKNAQTGNLDITAMNRIAAQNNGLHGQLLSPETAKHLQNVRAMLERANLVNRGMENPSGTGNAIYSKIPAWEAAEAIRRGLMGAGAMVLTGKPNEALTGAAVGAASPFLQNWIGRNWLNRPQLPEFPTLPSTSGQRALAGAAAGSAAQLKALKSLKR